MRQVSPLTESIKLFNEMRVQFVKRCFGIKHQNERPRQVSGKAAWHFGVKRCPGGSIVLSFQSRQKRVETEALQDVLELGLRNCVSNLQLPVVHPDRRSEAIASLVEKRPEAFWSRI
jgi:hypothetical protein